ncbi:MAG: response regulator [Deltaproteobacteria bacterium]|nr:response regulator [Deltaproteobacteria bacterium]
MVPNQSAGGWAPYARALGRNVRALIIDDEQVIRELLRAVLESGGYEVAEAEGLEEAREAISAEPFDLLLVDKNLPGGSGVDLLTEVQQQGLDVPSVMITAYPSAPSISAALRAGARDYIAKPFDDITQVLNRFDSVCAAGIQAKVYRRIIKELKAALVETRGEASVVKKIGRDLFEHKQDMRLKTDVLLFQQSEVISDVLCGALVLEGISVEERQDEEGALSLVGALGALTAIVSLESERSVELIREFKQRDPLLDILVTSKAPTVHDGLAALSHGISDLVLRSEGTEILQVRARRLVHGARQRQMNLFLISTLVRYARDEGFRGADEFLKLLPPVELDIIEGLVAPAPDPGEMIQPGYGELASLVDEAESFTPLFGPGSEPDLFQPLPPPLPPVITAPPPPAGFDPGAGLASPEPEPEPAGQDRRQHPRHEASLPVKLIRLPDRNQTLHTFTRDISARGLFVIDATPPPPGSEYEIEIRLKPGDPPVRAHGRVVRVDLGRRGGMGLYVEAREGFSLQALIDRLLG